MTQPKKQKSPVKSRSSSNSFLHSTAGYLQLERYFSKKGIMSRGQARTQILDGFVTVNDNRILDPEFKIDPDRDLVLWNEKNVDAQTFEYWILNKPKGFVTSLKGQNNEKTVYEIEGGPTSWMGPVGRLDKASEGLLAFTNDNLWANEILLPKSHITKTYHVQVSRIPSPDELAKLQQGVLLDDTLTLPAKWQILREGSTSKGWLEIELNEGKNRQIRRMLEIFNIEVIRLIRVQFGQLKLNDLAKGQWKKVQKSDF